MNELSLPNKDRKGEKSVLVFVFMPTYLPYKRMSSFFYSFIDLGKFWLDAVCENVINCRMDMSAFMNYLLIQNRCISLISFI